MDDCSMCIEIIGAHGFPLFLIFSFQSIGKSILMSDLLSSFYIM